MRCADRRPDSSGRNRTLVPALHGPGSSQRDDPTKSRFMGRFMERANVQKVNARWEHRASARWSCFNGFRVLRSTLCKRLKALSALWTTGTPGLSRVLG